MNSALPVQRRLIKFIISGGSAAVTEYGAFLILHSVFGVYLLLANSLSFCAGLVVSFSLNRKWVFSSRGKMHVELVQYVSLAVINLFLSNLLIYVGVKKLDLMAAVVKIATMVLIAAWNYLIFSKLIFRQRHEDA
jgi:putative flippase GtrA